MLTNGQLNLTSVDGISSDKVQHFVIEKTRFLTIFFNEFQFCSL